MAFRSKSVLPQISLDLFEWENSQVALIIGEVFCKAKKVEIRHISLSSQIQSLNSPIFKGYSQDINCI